MTRPCGCHDSQLCSFHAKQTSKSEFLLQTINEAISQERRHALEMASRKLRLILPENRLSDMKARVCEIPELNVQSRGIWLKDKKIAKIVRNKKFEIVFIENV